MDAVDTHQIAGWLGLGMAAVTTAGGIFYALIASREKTKQAEIASNEKIALNKQLLENEKEKANLKANQSELFNKVDANAKRAEKCEQDHKEVADQLVKCEMKHEVTDSLIQASAADRIRLWEELKAVKIMANGLNNKIASTSLAQGTAEGTAVGLAAGVVQGIAEGTATENAKHP